MRELINNILQDTSRDMREQADRVENAFAKRIEEMAGAKAKMENQLTNVNIYFFLQAYYYLDNFFNNKFEKNKINQTLDEIGRQEANIIELKKAIRNKEAPMKVAQTRLNDRSFRPGIELCRDPAHTQ